MFYYIHEKRNLPDIFSCVVHCSDLFSTIIYDKVLTNEPGIYTRRKKEKCVIHIYICGDSTHSYII